VKSAFQQEHDSRNSYAISGRNPQTQTGLGDPGVGLL
jgi:hypothetical protein